jgi:hypothetical protein
MGTGLGGVQILRQVNSLLDQVLSVCVARAQVVLQLRLRRFHLNDLGRLLGQLMAEIRDCLVGLLDLSPGDLALVTHIAQLFFERELGLVDLGGVAHAQQHQPDGGG